MTYIITKSKNYYILDTNLAIKILNDSPFYFEAGTIKKNTFDRIMPNNLGISKCPAINLYKTKVISNLNCPWMKRRIFNENVLGTQNMNTFFKCIPNIIAKNITEKPRNIDDFKILSFKIVANTIFGCNSPKYKKILNTYINIVKSKKNIKKTKFYKKYENLIHKGYKTDQLCSLLYLSNKYMNDHEMIIDDQIPHWFGPFIFIISFLIPILLCIILNNKDIYQKLMLEISSDSFNIFSTQTYLHCCIIEHIRLFNTININIQRTVNRTMTYEGINFKKGDQIFILFSSILRDQNKFFKPDQFIPERWTNQPEISQDFVFGIGPQQCPSKKITPVYYKSIIYSILKNYNYSNVKPILVSKNLYFINPYDIHFY